MSTSYSLSSGVPVDHTLAVNPKAVSGKGPYTYSQIPSAPQKPQLSSQLRDLSENSEFWLHFTRKNFLDDRKDFFKCQTFTTEDEEAIRREQYIWKLQISNPNIVWGDRVAAEQDLPF